MPNERVALLVRLAPELKLKLAELARHQRRSLSKQVEVLLEECLLRIESGSERACLETQEPVRTQRHRRKG